MRSGRLRRVITVQKTTETRTDTGAIVNTWGTFLTARAEIAPIKGNEPFASAHFRGESTIAITIRYRDGITSKMRILNDGVTYQIDSPPINDKNTDRQMVLLCSVVETPESDADVWVLYIPVGSDSYITSDALTYKVKE